MNTTNPTIDTEVVIAGGGPTGQMLACELALGGITAVVLDALNGPTPEPRANGLSGLAVRLLDHRGFYETITGSPDGPEPAPWATFAGFKLDLTATPSSQQYLLMVPQRRLTEILAERAAAGGADLRWGHSVRGFTQYPDHVAVEVDGPSGPYQIHAGYLVGADGGRSGIRKLAGIEFPGMSSNDAVLSLGRGLTPPPEWFDSATGELNVPGYGRVPSTNFLRSGTGMFLCGRLPWGILVGTLELAPAPDDTRVGPDHPGFGAEMTTAELEESISRVLGAHVPLQPTQPEGEVVVRRFAGLNSLVAERFRDGRVFLAGDAAHVQSPLGGPGLNLSLQDATNLAWKLAAVLKGNADPALLDTYDTERRLAADQVKMYSRAQLALFRPGPEMTALGQIFDDLIAQPAVAERLANIAAGALVRYPTESNDHPSVGHWVPDLTIDTADGTRRVAELARDGRPLLLDFTEHGVVADALDGNAPRINIVTGAPCEPVDLSAILVRPDGYVAWASAQAQPDTAPLKQTLGRWFGSNSPMVAGVER